MTGLELFAKLCDDISCVIPTIMLTGQGGEAIAVKAMKLGVEDYLVKGQYSPAGLRKAVEAIVRKPSEDGVLEVGSIFASRYEIVRLAGSGGMSSVYRALDRNTETYVALKVVRSPDHRLSSRFRREASVLAELDSATIVRYLGHGLTPDGDRFLAMEWLEGEDLATHLTNGPLSIEDTMSVAHRVADALKIAHKHGLIHRDVKPSNLFLPGKEISQAKLLDFGIALTTEADLSRFTRTGAAMGTPGYMAPEQALGLQTIDHRADIYGLGALLYHCLTGKPPFTDRLGTGIRSLLDPATPVSELREDIPVFLGSLVTSMLHREPQRRPQSAASILNALHQQSMIKMEATRPPSPKRNRPQSTRCMLLLATPTAVANVSFAHLDVLVRQREI
ncbi:MAG: protein kinase domain-containing protein, partial [Nannocystaceae bacterium]